MRRGVSVAVMLLILQTNLLACLITLVNAGMAEMFGDLCDPSFGGLKDFWVLHLCYKIGHH
jgi:hypothetical protein